MYLCVIFCFINYQHFIDISLQCVNVNQLFICACTTAHLLVHLQGSYVLCSVANTLHSSSSRPTLTPGDNPS